MSRIEVTDELLYKYVPILDKEEIQALEKEVDYEYQFSEEFERKMKRLIKRESRMWVEDFFRFLKRVAIVFLCIIGVMFALTMSVEAYRIKFFQTMQEIWEDSIIYTYFTDLEDQSFHPREPQYIPEGYEEISRSETDNIKTIIYLNDVGEQITFLQMLITDETKSAWDSEFEGQEVKEVNGGVLIISVFADGSINAHYERGNYIYSLVAQTLSREEIYKMFESM